MWRSRKDNLKRRMLSGILACLLVATSLTNTVGVISAFAAQGTDAPRVSYKYDDLVDDNGKLDKLVQINVQAENESFLPGSEMVLKVYVQNLSDQYLTGGSLKWNGKGLEEAGFLDEEEEDVFNGPGWDSGDSTGSDTTGGQDGGLMEELGSFSVTGLRKSVALRVDDTNPADGTDGEEGQAPEEKPETIGGMDFTEITEIQDSDEDDSDEPETDEEGKRIKGIELAPGEVYETRFYGTVEDLDSIVTRKVTFEFLAGVDGNDQKLAQDKTEFTYNTGMALVLPVEFEDGPALMTNELNTLYIRTRFEDEKILDEYTWDVTGGDEDEATPADAQRHEITVATMSNGDGDSSEGTTPANMKYSIVTYGAKLLGIEAWRDEDKSDWGEVATGVSFRVADGTEPGVYFGQVTTSIRRDGKNYKTTQGFHFFVLGDGQIVLKGNVGGAEIQVKGDRKSFPEGDMLSLKVTEVPEEKMGLVQEAMAQKADELGVSVDKMMVVDIKVIADGEEQELRGDVEVTFSNLQMQSLDGNLDSDETAEAAEANDAAEAEEFEEISNHSVFGLRKAAAQNDDVTQVENPADNLTDDSQVENGEEKEDSSLAVWHFNEDQGSIDEMDSETNDDGDLVMDTDHFSIFIVVQTETLTGTINLTVQHWAKVSFPEGGANENETGTNGLTGYRGPNGNDKNTIGELSGNTATVRMSSSLTEIYAPDQFTLDNQFRRKIEDLSKICIANSKRTIKNYTLSEIWVLKEGKSSTSENKADWTQYNPNSTADVSLTKDNTIRLVYTPVSTPDSLKNDVTFYDYDITDGKRYSSNGNVNQNGAYVRILDEKTHKGLGINSDGNYTGGNANNRLAVMPNSGFYNLYQSVRGGDQQGNTKYYINRSGNGNKTGFEIVTGMVRKKEVGEGVNENGPIYNGLYDPGLFNDTAKTGKTILKDYKLWFNQDGDTYTLSKVYEGETKRLENLEKFEETYDNGTKQLFSNSFWPLDNENHKNQDPKFGAGGLSAWNGNGNVHDLLKSDEGKAHNWFFGMRYDFKFTLGDYTGPLKYYFRGDDDLWLFIDNRLVIDIGGIHNSVGKSVDLSYLKNEPKDKKHTLTVIYAERGGYGSSCYMQFTIPNIEPVDIDTTTEKTDVTVRKVWNDFQNPYRPVAIDVQLKYRERGDKNWINYGNPVTLTTPKEGSKEIWSYTWKDLPKTGYEYKVEELTIKGTSSAYKVEYSNGGVLEQQGDGKYLGTITNTLSPQVKVEVVKIWDDQNNQDGNRPETVTMSLQYKPDGTSEYLPFPGEKGRLELDGISDSNGEYKSWNGRFEGLPAYIDGVKVSYRVRELNGNTVLGKDSTLPGKNQGTEWRYTVTSCDDEPQNPPDPEDGKVVRTTTITNTYTPKTVERSVTKKWVDVVPGEEPVAKVGLFAKNSSDDSWTLTSQDIKEMIGPNETTQTWTGLPKYVDGAEVIYGVFEVDGKNQPITGADSKIVLNSYQYEITHQETGTLTTITNKLLKAKLRVAKWITNWNEALDRNDLLEDEFIIKVWKEDSTESSFETGLVLKHAGTDKGSVDSSRISGYIEVPVKAGGQTFKVDEIVPKEYEKLGFHYINSYKDGTSIMDSPESGSIIVNPGDDGLIVVYNQFGHKDYFHHDVSVTNLFRGSEPIQKSAANLVVPMGAFLAEEMNSNRERKYQDEERFM